MIKFRRATESEVAAVSMPLTRGLRAVQLLGLAVILGIVLVVRYLGASLVVQALIAFPLVLVLLVVVANRRARTPR
jgi:hypothetical protein